MTIPRLEFRFSVFVHAKLKAKTRNYKSKTKSRNKIMETLLRDLRYGFRVLIKRPGFTVVAVAALALGIGANSAIFSVVNAVMLKPLPFADPSHLVSANSLNSLNPQSELGGVSPADFWDWKEQSQAFEELAALSGGSAFSVKDADDPDVFNGARVSFNFFHAFGVQPLIGRVFSAEDGDLNAPATVVMSHRLWMRRFGGDPSVVGRTFNSADGGTTVIGVMPPNFKFPSYAEVWTPMARNASEMRNRSNRYFNVFGRIKAGQSIESAQAELNTVASHLETEYPRSNKGWSARLTPLRESLMGSTRTALSVLLGAVGCVLLIACTNVANLLLARAASRRKEMAIRLALGAGRAKLIRQLLTESLLLGLAGGAVGLLLAGWGLELLIGILPSKEAFQLPVEIRIDPGVMLFTLVISALTGIVFGLVPAWQASRPDVNECLKEGGRTGSNAGHQRTRNALIIAEIAIALVLLIGAGLLVQSFVRLRQVDLGYEPKGLLTMWVSASPTRYRDDEARARFFKRLQEQASLVPGVESISSSSESWFGLLNFQFNIESDPLPNGDENVRYSAVAPNYFNVLKAQIRAGRDFNDQDDLRAPAVAIVNETLARRYFSDGQPIGRKIMLGYLGRRMVREIVGVSSDIKQEELGSATKPEMYVPMQQVPWFGTALVVRSTGDPMRLKKDLQAAIWQVDKDLPVSSAETVEQHLADLVAEPRLYTLLLGVFAIIALLLASIGIYGVMSYSVTERTHEIGIRMALGAKQADVLGFVIKQGLTLTITGLSIGVAVSFALTRLMDSLLYGVSATDPVTFVVISLLLALVSIFATYLPARRATRVDPMIALRHE
jgi:putative ABC transport system permease protein